MKNFIYIEPRIPNRFIEYLDPKFYDSLPSKMPLGFLPWEEVENGIEARNALLSYMQRRNSAYFHVPNYIPTVNDVYGLLDCDLSKELRKAARRVFVLAGLQFPRLYYAKV